MSLKICIFSVLLLNSLAFSEDIPDSLHKDFREKSLSLKVEKEYLAIDKIYESILDIHGIKNDQLNYLAREQIKHLKDSKPHKYKDKIQEIEKDNRLVFEELAKLKYKHINSMWHQYGDKLFKINAEQIKIYNRDFNFMKTKNIDSIKVDIMSKISIALLYREIRKEYRSKDLKKDAKTLRLLDDASHTVFLKTENKVKIKCQVNN